MIPAVEAVSFGKYLLCERLAEGGMAIVWRAKIVGPSGFEKEFCVKQIRHELAEKREFIDLFVAEAKLTVSLTHANIVPVYELGMVEDTYFLALELIDGPSLARLLKRGPMPAPLAAYVTEQILRGLDYAHRRGVVHRDLTPANVLVSRDGEVKIVDFGIAAHVDGRGVRGGSAGYMAPEQERGGRIDARSDLFAAGVVLAEMLAGRRLAAAELEPEVPEQLRAIAERATAADPEARFPDAAAMLAQVSRYLRDLSMGPTQSELSTFVRQRAPDVPRASSDGPRTSRAANGTGPQTALASRTGPQTALANRTGPQTALTRQVSFATRVELAELVGEETQPAPQPSATAPSTTARPTTRTGRSPLVLTSAIGLVVGLVGALALARLGSTPATSMTTTTPAPTTPAPTPTPTTPPTPIAPQPTLGRLVVRTTPPGAEVRAGETVLGTTPLETDAPLSTRAVTLRRRGHQPLERALAFVGTPPTAIVNERLAPLGRGTLTLNAIPWAQVTIDGERRGDTPLRGLQLAAGPHQVRLVCPPTGRELKFTVTVEPDSEQKRVADLRGDPHLVDE
jgi:serine/threonine-protein kinase